MALYVLIQWFKKKKITNCESCVNFVYDEELGCEVTEVTKFGEGSELLRGYIKEEGELL